MAYRNLDRVPDSDTLCLVLSGCRLGCAFYNSKGFQENRQRICSTLSKLPFHESPMGWQKKFDVAVGGLQYIGFSELCDSLLVVSLSGRGVFDLSTGEKIERDYSENGNWLNETLLTCRGIGILADETIKIAGLGGGGFLTYSNKGEHLEIVSPLFPCSEVVFEPYAQSCFIDGKNQGCAIIHKGYVKPNMCGFSYSYNYLVVTDEDIHVWERVPRSKECK